MSEFDDIPVIGPGEADQAQELKSAQDFARLRAPDKAARTLRVANDQGLGFETAEALPEPKPPELDWNTLAQDHPVLAKTLTDQGKAAALQADVKPMGTLEKLFRGWRDIAWEASQGWEKGSKTVELATLALKQKEGKATPADLSRMDLLEKETAREPDMGYISGLVPASAEQAPNMLFSLNPNRVYQGAAVGAVLAGGAALVAGAPVAAPVLLGAAAAGAKAGHLVGATERAGMLEEGLAYREYIKEPGVKPEDAALASTIVRYINGSLESIGLESVLRLFPVKAMQRAVGRKLMLELLKDPTKKAAVASFLKHVAEGAVSEGVTEALQEMSTILNRSVAGAQLPSFGDALQRTLDAGKGGAYATFAFSGPRALIGLRLDLQEAKLAEDRVNFWKGLAQTALDSKTLATLSDERAAYVRELQQRYGVVPEVKMPLEKLQTLFQEAGRDLATELPGVQRQAASGADEVVVSTEDVASKVAGLKGFESIIPDIRVGDGFTTREAAQVRKDVAGVMKEMEKPLAEGEEPTPARRVFQDVVQKREVLGTPAAQARQEASLWAAFTESRAKRGAAKDAWAYYQKQQLDITHQDITTELQSAEAALAKDPSNQQLKHQVTSLMVARDFTALEQADPNEVTIEELNPASPYPWYRFSIPGSPLYLEGKIEEGTFIVSTLGPLSFANETPESQRMRSTWGGKGVATALYIRALQFAKNQDLSFESDQILLPASMRMYARLQEMGLPIQQLRNALDLPVYRLPYRVLRRVPVESLWEKYKSQLREKGVTLFQEGGQQQEFTPPFWSAVENALDLVKQEKGDPKSWWAVVSKAPGVKKEELEYIGLKKWLDDIEAAWKRKDIGEVMTLLGVQDAEAEKFRSTFRGTLTKEQVGNFIQSHKVDVRETVLESTPSKRTAGAPSSAPGSITEDRLDEIRSDLNDFPISWNEDSDGQFTFAAEGQTTEESDNIDSILEYVSETSSSRTARELERLSAIVENFADESVDMEEVDPDAVAQWEEDNPKPRRRDDLTEWKDSRKAFLQSLREGALESAVEDFNSVGEDENVSVRVTSRGVTRYSGFAFTTEEYSGPDEVSGYLRDTEGSRAAHEFDAIVEELAAAGLIDGSPSTLRKEVPWSSYQLKSGKLATPGSYRNIILTTPLDKWESTGHYQGIPGYLAHARFAEHIINGKKVLFIEEIQSDRFQSAYKKVAAARNSLKTLQEREDAVPNADVEAKYKAIIKAGGMTSVASTEARLVPVTGTDMKWKDPATGYESAETDRHAAAEELNRDAISDRGLVPEAPLHGAWPEAMMRRLLFWAAEEGYTSIGWVTGTQTLERWDNALLERVDTITLTKDAEGYTFDARQNDSSVQKKTVKSPADLADWLGSNIAEKLLQKLDAAPGEAAKVQGKELTVGGSAFRRMMDRELPSVVESVGKAKPQLVAHPGLAEQETMWRAGPDTRSALQKLLDAAIRKETIRDRVLAEKYDKDEGASSVRVPRELLGEPDTNSQEDWMMEQPRAAARLLELRAEAKRIEEELKLVEHPDLFGTVEQPGEHRMRSSTELDATEKALRDKLLDLQAEFELIASGAGSQMSELDELKRLRETLGHTPPGQEHLLFAEDDNAAGVTSAQIRTALADVSLTASEVQDTLEMFDAQAEGEKVWVADIAPERMQEIAQVGVPLYQKTTAGTPRGSISFSPQRDYFRVTLTGKANLSTFLHESGHAFLEMMRRDAEAGHTETQADLLVLDQWLGRKAGEEYTREQLEQFARGFEAYLREGKAPSEQLVGAFQQFKAWLRFVYRHLFQLDVELTDEVRQVMDRMLASDDEIAFQTQKLRLLPVLGPESMPKQAYEAYRSRFEKGLKEARDRLEREAIAELRRGVGEEADRVRAEVTEEVDADPAQRAIAFLRTGKGLEGAAEDFTGKKLDWETVKNMKGTLGIPGMADYNLRKLRVLSEEKGIHPDVLAPYFGFITGHQLLDALSAAPARRQAIQAKFEQRMVEKYPGYGATPAWLEETALKELHSNEVGLALQTELEALGKQVTAENPKSARAAIQLAAREAVAKMTVLELQPGRFLRAEEQAARLAQEAYAAKDFQEAYSQKRRQLWAREMWKLVSREAENAAKTREYLSSFQDLSVRKRIGMAGQDYLGAIDAIIEGLDFRTRGLKSMERRASYLSYLQNLQDAGEPVAIPPDLTLKNWRELSVDELSAVKAAVENLAHLAQLKNKIRLGRELRSFNDTVNQATAHIESTQGVNYSHKPGTPTWWAKKKEWLDKGYVQLKKVEFVCRELDGGKTAGFIHSLLFQPLVLAQADKAQLSEQVLMELRRPFDEMSLQDRLRYDTRVDFLGHSLLLRDVLAVALNMGNDGNMVRLLTGYGWSEEAVKQRLSELLNAKDVALLNHIWKTVGSLWPQIKALSERVIGVAPEQVEATPFKLGELELTGGYYPIVKDPKASTLGLQTAERKTGEVFENHFLRPVVESGFTKARGNDMSPLLLSLDVVPAHLNEVIHYLTHYEAVRAVDRLTNDKRMKAAIEGALGHEVWKMFRPWLQAIAADGNIHQNTTFIESVLRHLRFGSSIVLLGGKVTTALMQTLGLTVTAKEVGLVNTAKGIGEFMAQFAKGNPFQEVNELSSELKNIDRQVDRDITQYFERMTSVFSEYGHLKSQLAHFALGGMMLVQKAVNAITWYAARQKALDEGHADPVAFANSTVRLSQTGGGILNTAAVQRVSEGARIFVVMYTYFSVLFNQLAEKSSKTTTLAKVGDYAARWWWAVLLPVMLEGLMRGKEPDRKRDEGDWLHWLAVEQLIYVSRTVPLAGALAEAFLNEREARTAPWLTAVLRGAALAGKEVSGDRMSDSEKKALFVEALGTLTHTPTLAAWNASRFLEDFTSGKMDEPVQDLLFRSPKEFK